MDHLAPPPEWPTSTASSGSSWAVSTARSSIFDKDWLSAVGLSAERAAKEMRIRDDMIRVAHRAGASIGQLADVSGPGRKTVTAIVSAEARLHD